MRFLLREVTWIALACGITWWVLFRPPQPATILAESPMQKPLSVALTPLSESPPVEVASAPRAQAPPAEAPARSESEELPAPAAEEEAVEEQAEEELPPPPELGTPDGEGDAATAANETPELPAEDAAAEEPAEPDEADPSAEVGESAEPVEASDERSAEQLMADSELLTDARAEVSGESKKGFATVLLASPEEQLEIARFFGEKLVLVPRENLNPEAESPTYFSVVAGSNERVQVVSGRAPLEGYRQYRDLFDYEYARLPDALRELRRSVFARNEIFLFAALIPVEEWAVIVGRRREALNLSGREISDVRRFVLRYVKRSQQGFDLRVEEILFADEERFRPPRESQSKGI